jgi:tRNA (guanine26-N2/guanine27-N2)-dimethyltransferase
LFCDLNLAGYLLFKPTNVLVQRTQLGRRRVNFFLATALLRRTLTRFARMSSSTLETIREGQAEVLKPSKNAVFYNPAQCVNRDLSVSMIQAFIDRRREEIRARAKQRLEKQQQQHSNTKSDEPITAEPKAEKSEDHEEMEGDEDTKLTPVKQSTRRSQVQMQDEEVTIFEALAASGLRSIRYFKELKGVKHIVVNDLDPGAVSHIRANIAHNGASDLPFV